MGRRNFFPLLLSLFLTAGCAGGETALSSETDVRDRAGNGLTARQLESAPRPLTEEEVRTAYERAAEACGWFELSPLPDSGETVQTDGVTYRRVSAPGLEKVEDLRTYLRSLFSGEVTERLLASGGPCYRDIGGALYVSAAGRPRDPGKGEVRVEVSLQDDAAYSVDVTVELLDNGGAAGLECWSFPYALVDGRWVFTDFRLVY